MKTRSALDWISNFFYGESNMYDSVGVWAQFLVSGVLFVGLLVIAVVVYYLVRKLLLGVFTKLVKLTKDNWGDALMCSWVFKWLALMGPVALLWHLSSAMFGLRVFQSPSGADVVKIGERCEKDDGV